MGPFDHENNDGIFDQLKKLQELSEEQIIKSFGIPAELVKGFELKPIQSPFVKEGCGYLLLHPADLHKLRESQKNNET